MTTNFKGLFAGHEAAQRRDDPMGARSLKNIQKPTHLSKHRLVWLVWLVKKINSYVLLVETPIPTPAPTPAGAIVVRHQRHQNICPASTKLAAYTRMLIYPIKLINKVADFER